MTVMPRPIDRADPANALVISDEAPYFNNTPGVWRRITARRPNSNGIYITLTNQMTLSKAKRILKTPKSSKLGKKTSPSVWKKPEPPIATCR
jgi:hypothetical protein